MSHKAVDIIKELKKASTPERAKANAWFFKTGEGEYGYGDKFIGVSVPDQRKVARQFRDIDLTEIKKLLYSEVHEHRLTALLILTDTFKRVDEKKKEEIVKFYLANISRVNNWDMVDLSAPGILGAYLKEKPKEILFKLAQSNNIWERRIAIISTQTFIKNKDTAITYDLAKLLLKDPHDLMHKAVGWMLREAGQVDQKQLLLFLETYAGKMPRTMLRYAIEKLVEKRRKHFMSKPRE